MEQDAEVCQEVSVIVAAGLDVLGLPRRALVRPIDPDTAAGEHDPAAHVLARLADVGPAARGGQELPTLAVSLHDIVIHNNKKWFGEADIRLDALVITGYGTQDDPRSFYMPKTASFARVLLP